MALRLDENVTIQVYSASDLYRHRRSDGSLPWRSPDEAPETVRLLPVQEFRAKNRIVKGGRNILRDLIGLPVRDEGQLPAYTPDYMALGTGSTTVDDAQTALVTEVFRKQLTRKLPGDSAITFKLFVDTAEANGSGTQAIKEAALYTLTSGGTMFARVTHATINKSSAISIVYQWVITLAAA